MTSPQILIVQLGRLGDFILATPMLRALKQAQPQCRIHVLASRHNAALARLQPEIERVYLHSKRVLDTLKLLARLKRARYDFWIDPKDHFSREGSLLARWGNADCKIGFKQEGGKKVFDVGLPSQEEQHVHAAWRNLYALRAMGVESDNPRPSLHLSEAARARWEQRLAARGLSQYCCVNVSAGNEIRYWPPARWTKFLQAIKDDARAFVLTAAGKDAALAETIAQQTPYAYYFPTRELEELLAVLQRAELVISPDTSVIHMAAAFDRPVLGLYSNHEWNYKKFYPLSTHRRIVIPPAVGGLIKDITFESALEKFYELLAEISPTKVEHRRK